MMLFLIAGIVAASTSAGTPADSATITLRPYNKSTVALNWVSFDEKKRPIDRGAAPAVTKQASDGTPITYCAEDTKSGFLELVVDVGGGQMTAYAYCTRVIVHGKAVKTMGVEDPRLSR